MHGASHMYEYRSQRSLPDTHVSTQTVMTHFRLCMVGLLGAGSQILKLLLRIPPHWQTITAFPIGLTEETLVSEPIFKALYDVTSLKPLDKASA